MSEAAVLVGVVMGSNSDWEIMQHAVAVLREFQVPHEVGVVSAHRMPREMVDYAATASDRGLRVLVAGAGGAAHLPGMLASLTPLPVIGVPVPLRYLDGLDSLLSTVQMPAGIPVATVAIGKAGAINAAILAVQMLSLSDPQLAERLAAHRREQAEKVDRANDRLREQRGGAA